MNVSIDEMADVIQEGLEEYASMTAKDVKRAVRKAGRTVREQIKETAPQRSGAYAQSWTVRKIKETSESLHVVVHSKNRYTLAHLLENGHALRGGGRTRAFVHIAPAEEEGEKQLIAEIERALK